VPSMTQHRLQTLTHINAVSSAAVRLIYVNLSEPHRAYGGNNRACTILSALLHVAQSQASRVRLLIALALASALLLTAQAAVQPAAPVARVVVLNVEGVIAPTAADYVERAIDSAAENGAAIEDVQPDWRTRVLQVITNPSIALLLMLFGIYGLYFDLATPGFGLPGIAGAICLLLALFAFQLLPVNYAGLALLLLGIALIIAEALLPGFGILGAGGIAAFIVGALLLVRTDVPGFGIPLSLTLGLALFSAAFILLVARLAVKARRRPVVSGREALVGSTGEVIEAAAR